MTLVTESNNPENINLLTCCGDYSINFVGVILNLSGFLLIFLLIAVSLQYWICKKPNSLIAKYFIYILYILGAISVLLFVEMIYEAAGDSYTQWPLIQIMAVFFGLIFSSYVLTTHHLLKYKKISKGLFVKVLIALIVFQVFIQIEIKILGY